VQRAETPRAGDQIGPHHSLPGMEYGRTLFMTIEELERVCLDFEDEHGIDAFLDAMAAIMQRRLLKHGLEITFDDAGQEDPESLHR
jgi:hypothetical protein